MTVSVAEIVAVVLSSFSVGFALCNAIYMFGLRSHKRNDHNNKTGNADKQSEERDSLRKS